MRLRRSVAVLGALVTAWGLSLAVAAPAAAEPNCNVPIPPPACGEGPEDPPPPTGRSPILAFDGALQHTVSMDRVHISGWTADDDAPTTPLSVIVTVDGTTRYSGLANHNRPDVAAVYPRFGAIHGFDVVLPVNPNGSTICVTAVSVGGGSNKQNCRAMDKIVRFEGTDIHYNLSGLRILSANLETLDRMSHTNGTTVAQSTTLSNTKTVTESQGWSDTSAYSVGVSTTIQTGIPILANGQVTVSASAQFTYARNGSTTRTRAVTWSQPIVVPPKSRVEATITVTTGTITVPYTMTGKFYYQSGAQVDGHITGEFRGVNSGDLDIVTQQYDLNGNPALAPAAQPPATLLKIA